MVMKQHTLKHKEKNMTSNKFRKPPSGAGIKKTFQNIVSHARRHIKNLKPKCKKMLTELAYAAAQELASDLPIALPRVIPVPKTGGFLPLIPIFAGLSAAGSLAGGVAGITRAINDYKTAKKNLLTLKRSGRGLPVTQSICVGKGLHLKPYKDGLGIYVTKSKN